MRKLCNLSKIWKVEAVDDETKTYKKMANHITWKARTPKNLNNQFSLLKELVPPENPKISLLHIKQNSRTKARRRFSCN